MVQVRHKGKLTRLVRRCPNDVPVRKLWHTMSAIEAQRQTFCYGIVSAVQVRREGRLTSLVSLVRSWLSMIGKCVT